MGRAHGADAVDGGRAGHGGVQGAGVRHCDDHRADGEIAAGKAVGTGDGLDGAGGRLKGAVDGHIHALADKISGGVGGGEIQHQQQGGIGKWLSAPAGQLLSGKDAGNTIAIQGHSYCSQNQLHVEYLQSSVLRTHDQADA